MELINECLQRIKPVDEKLVEKAQERLDQLTKPMGSLGRLELIARKMGALQHTITPQINKKAVVLMAGDHGVTNEGVSAYPSDVTYQMVLNFARGGAAINVLSRHVGADVYLVDMGVKGQFKDVPGLIDCKVAEGTASFAIGPAMTREQAVQSINHGINIARKCKEDGCSIIGLGEMGIGNTTPSSAITSIITNKPILDVTGKGTGITEESRRRKVEVISRSIDMNKPDRKDAVDILAKVGGFEIGGLAGVVIGAVAEGLPVVVDGFITTAAALLAVKMNSTIRDYLFCAHMSVEPGHQYALNYLGENPLLDMNMRLGEGTGAALAISLIEASCKIISEMATFGEANVSESF